jgi:hypothetical protein
VLIDRVMTEKQCQNGNDEEQIANPRQFAEDRGLIVVGVGGPPIRYTSARIHPC